MSRWMRPLHREGFGYALLAAVLAVACASRALCQELALPVVDGRWLRPAEKHPAQPVWGHAEGLRVGLEPMPGPRGLLRVYAPSLGLPEARVINYVAVEPVLRRETRRSLSELERSTTDGRRGKRFWSSDTSDNTEFRSPDEPVRGIVETVDGVETLRVFVQVEPFNNGAHVYLRLTFRADRPDEVGIATFSHDDSRRLRHCVITATMGNFARLRQLHLAEEVVTAGDIWPDYRDSGFASPVRFRLDKLSRNPEGDAIVAATPDEADPRVAKYAPGTRGHWKYSGEVATQSWRCENPDANLNALVNGRYAYWSSRSPIPGGISFENFELFAPFKQGGEFWFGVQRGIHATSSN